MLAMLTSGYQPMCHESCPTFGSLGFLLGHEIISKKCIYIYIIVYIIRLLIMFNNKQIKLFIGSWNIFKLRIIKKRVMKKTGWEPLIVRRFNEGCV